MEKVGVCLIGCGGISRSHIRAYSEIKEVSLLAVVDIDESCALAAKEESDARFSFTDYARALEMDEVDMVDICLPTHLHAEAAIAVAKSGKHILTEKPIALTLEDADKMSRAASDAGVKFTVGFGLRFSTRMMKFAQLVREGALGRPVILRSVNSRAAPSRPWYMDAKKGGGPVIDKAVHTYDICRYLFGSSEALAEPTSVQASTFRFQESHSAVDTTNAIVNFDSGDSLAMLLSWGLPRGAKGTSMQDAIGPRGHLAFGAPPEITKDVDTKKYGFITLSREKEPICYKFENNSHMKDQLQSFIKAIIEDKEPEVTAYDGRRALEMGLAILESGRTGRVVELTPKKAKKSRKHGKPNH